MKTSRILPYLAATLILLGACQGADDQTTDETTSPVQGKTATWHLLDDDVSAESTSLEIGVMRVECAGGETGTVLEPKVSYQDDQIVIESLVETLPDGAYTCLGNNVVPFKVELAEPIGDRDLVDGICTTTGGGGDCAGGGVRWPRS